MNEDGLERVEMKVAFLEHANNELSDVVYRQQQELAALTAKVAALTERLNSAKGDQQTSYSAEEERPPHY